MAAIGCREPKPKHARVAAAHEPPSLGGVSVEDMEDLEDAFATTLITTTLSTATLTAAHTSVLARWAAGVYGRDL